MLAIKNLFIEGPDCSGKTTLVESIHKSTNYRYHIMDRSQISRKIFAHLYNRDISNLKQDYLDEILDLNNLYLFLLPSWEVIKKRYNTRGDEKHDISSLYKVYASFKKYYECAKGFRNIISLDDENIDTRKVAGLIKDYENMSLTNISKNIISTVSSFKNNEAVNLKFSLNPEISFPGASFKSMQYEKEKNYYKNIYDSFFKKIDDEILGINEYNRKEGITSRRFMYSNDSCISQIHALYRDDLLTFNIILRSSNVENTFYYDLKFLYYLASKIKSEYFSNVSKVHMRFNLNSAHII